MSAGQYDPLRGVLGQLSRNGDLKFEISDGLKISAFDPDQLRRGAIMGHPPLAATTGMGPFHQINRLRGKLGQVSSMPKTILQGFATRLSMVEKIADINLEQQKYESD